MTHGALTLVSGVANRMQGELPPVSAVIVAGIVVREMFVIVRLLSWMMSSFSTRTVPGETVPVEAVAEPDDAPCADERPGAKKRPITRKSAIGVRIP